MFNPISQFNQKIKELEEENNIKDEIIVDLQNQSGVHIKKTQHYLNKIRNKKK